MYYSSGNYEAFARPVKPEGVDDKSAYIIGSGLGALACSCFLVREDMRKAKKFIFLKRTQFQEAHVMDISMTI